MRVCVLSCRKHTDSTLKLTDPPPLSGCEAIARVMCGDGGGAACAIETLDLGWNKITDQGCSSLGRLLRARTRLRSLIVRHNDFTHVGFETLAEALLLDCRPEEATPAGGGADADRAPGLRHLNLRFNNGGAQGAASMARLLRSPRSPLVELDLSCAGVGDQGAEALAAALALHCEGGHADGGPNGNGHGGNGGAWGLRSLHLANNEIGDGGAGALQRALDSNEFLVALDLSENAVGPDRKRAFQAAAAKNGVMPTPPPFMRRALRAAGRAARTS